MIRYWTKNRLLFDILVPIVIVVLVAFAFIVPMFNSIGESTLMQSLYNNDKLDFDVPSPSYTQIAELEAESFIKSVFPYYYTEIDLTVEDKTRETNLFFSDAFDKLEQTMYCESRLIKKSTQTYNNPILVDYQFVQDTGATLGSTVSATLGGIKIDFQIEAIYETNTNYDNGAVIAKWEGSQKNAIMAISPKLVYSGAYIQASDYQQCKSYLETQYKPYGRLRDVSEFATQEAYQTHYNAFMSANYANEITNFAVKGQDVQAQVEAKNSSSTLSTILACVVSFVVLIVSNFALWFRKSERGYFAKRKVSGDGNVRSYYVVSTIVQTIVFIVGIIVATMLIPSMTAHYIPASVVVSKTITLMVSAAIAMVFVFVENVILAKKIKK